MRHAGSTHDSSAWKRSSLYQRLSKRGGLPWGYWIAGDEAYANLDWLLTPYSASGAGSYLTRVYKDSFNFHHSSQRITVECAFGILVKRWGIFWRPIEVQLPCVKKVVGACLSLHNICVDCHESERLASIPSGKDGWGAGPTRRPKTRRVGGVSVHDGMPVVHFQGECSSEEVSHRGQAAGRGSLREQFRKDLQKRGVKRPANSGHGMAFSRH